MENESLNLREALDHLDPSRLSYQEWVNVGMALKQEGLPADLWESWSAKDPARYHPGECLRKWSSFRGTGAPVTGGTLIQYALNQGWIPARSGSSAGEGHALDWEDTIGGSGARPGGEGRGLDWEDTIGSDGSETYLGSAGQVSAPDSLRVVDQAWVEVRDVPPPPEPFDGVRQLTRYLSLLFDSSEIVGYVTSSYVSEEGRCVPTKGAYDRTAGELIQLLNAC